MKKLLPIVWVFAIGSIVLLGSLLKLESSHFLGIADNHEQTISFSYPVEIVQTFAVEGGEVNQGMQILEVRRRDLSTKLAIIKEQIQALKSTDNEEIASTVAKLAGLRAQQGAELAEIDAQIQTLKSQQELNVKLLSEISGKKTQVSSKSPLETQIQGLREQRRHIEVSLTAQIDNLQSQLDSSERPVNAKLAELKERESEFERQVTDLQVLAKFNGRVGSVHYKPGEMVEPFQPILTVHGMSPQFIKGYIHENVFNQVAVGQQVWVKSNANSNQSESINAVVESLGNRIVEYPVRLKKNMMVSAWGREAVIRLVQEHSLLLGEKVIVSLKSPSEEINMIGGVVDFFASAIGQSIASTDTRQSGEPEGYPIRSLLDDLKDHELEASGIIQTSNPGFYFVVSDESKDKQPELFKLNDQGEVIQRLSIKTSKKVDDLESISSNGNNIYVLSSLDRTKKKRRQLLRLTIDQDDNVVLDGRINLFKALERLSKSSSDEATRQFLKHAIADKTIQIEAHAVKQNSLYVGFKTPHNTQGETVFIKIDNLDTLFAGKQVQVEGTIWRNISLLDPQTGSPTYLSDMLFYGDELLLLGVNDSHSTPSSHLWSFKTKTSKLTSIKSFDRLKAEGISATLKQDEVLVVFDGDGVKASRFLPVDLQTKIN